MKIFVITYTAKIKKTERREIEIKAETEKEARQEFVLGSMLKDEDDRWLNEIRDKNEEDPNQLKMGL